MKRNKILTVLFLTGLFITSCDQDLLDQANPNAPTSESFWKTEDDAMKGINAAYAGIQNREITLWELFNYDMRSDEGYSQSPWTDLANVGKFVMNDYNVPFNREIWHECYRVIFRCNQVLAFVPLIEMDENLKTKILAEAKFIRGHIYYKLVTLWGKVPLVLTIQTQNDRPDQGTLEQVWAQIEKDFSEAKTDLPEASDVTRATRQGATAYLGKAFLQQRKWADASAQFKEIIDKAPGTYDLMPNFGDNFKEATEKNKESLFEIEFVNNNAKASGFPTYDVSGGDETYERGQFLGIRSIGWCDGQPTKWLLNQFMIETDKDGNVDPRLQYTLTYKHYYTQTEADEIPTLDRSLYHLLDDTLFVSLEHGPDMKPLTYPILNFSDNDRFWRKYTNWESRTSYFSGINQRVIRLADVYLMYAECLNEQGQTPAAIPYANLVRARSNMPDLSLAMSTDDLRKQLQHDRVMELAGESVRFVDMKRYGILSPSLAGNTPNLAPNEADNDTEFKSFIVGKSEYLPIPLYEIDAYGGKLKQNDGW